MTNKYNPTHYHTPIEPWDFIQANNLDFFVGNIVKYLVRAGNKNGETRLDDLLKAKAYLTKVINAELDKVQH